jgi:hypothetical protein
VQSEVLNILIDNERQLNYFTSMFDFYVWETLFYGLKSLKEERFSNEPNEKYENKHINKHIINYFYCIFRKSKFN